MKKFIKITAVVLVLLLIAAVIIPFLIPLDEYKGQIIRQVKEQTGRDLNIEGNIKANIFPVIGVKINKASLSNPEGYKAKNMIDIDGLTVEVGLWALLHKQVQIKQFSLTKPILNLEISSNGQANWEFTNISQSKKAEKTEITKNNKEGEALLAGLMFGDIKITDGVINFLDHKNKRNIALTAFNLKASLPDITKQLTIEADTVWNNEKLIMQTKLAKPDQIMAGKKSGFEFSLKSGPLTIQYTGEVTQTNVSGNIDISSPSIPTLAKWVGSSFAWDGPGKLALTVHSRLAGDKMSISLHNTEFSLDSTKFKGDMGVQLDKKVPEVTIVLTTDSLNLNSFIKQAYNETYSLITPAIAAEYSNDRIDLSGLNAVNAKFDLNLGNILYKKVKIGKTIVNASLNSGLLKLQIPQMVLYGGEAKINTTIDSSGDFNKQSNITNINLGNLLNDLATNNRFSGTLNANYTISGKLTSVKNMVASLAGSGSIKVSDGAIKGVDLKNMVDNIKSSFTNIGNTEQQTVFSNLSGTYTISKGIISNNDLLLKSELMLLNGKGTIDLPMQTIQYRLNPELVSTVKRGDGSSTKGLEIPIIVQGPLDNPQFVPDLAGMARNTLENPNALKNTVKSLKEQFKGGKPDLNQVQDLLKGLGQ